MGLVGGLSARRLGPAHGAVVVIVVAVAVCVLCVCVPCADADAGTSSGVLPMADLGTERELRCLLAGAHLVLPRGPGRTWQGGRAHDTPGRGRRRTKYATDYLWRVFVCTLRRADSARRQNATAGREEPPTQRRPRSTAPAQDKTDGAVERVLLGLGRDRGGSEIESKRCSDARVSSAAAGAGGTRMRRTRSVGQSVVLCWLGVSDAEGERWDGRARVRSFQVGVVERWPVSLVLYVCMY